MLCRLFRAETGHHLITKSFGCGVEHDLARPSDDERRYRARGLDGDVEPHPGSVDADRLEVVFDVLPALLESVTRVPDHPVRAPVVFQDLVVDEPENLDGGFHMMRATVGVPVQYLNPLVHRRPS